MVDATTGALTSRLGEGPGGVEVATPDGAGGYYIGGDFMKVGGLTRHHLAHILASGAVDRTFNPDANGTVYALAVSGSTVYAGGSFTYVHGHPRTHLAALQCATPVRCGPGGPARTDRSDALAVSGSTVYAGGKFTRVAGQTRSRHRGPEHGRRGHGLGPQRERRRLRPRPLGFDRLRRRPVHADRRPDARRHRRPRRGHRRGHGLGRRARTATSWPSQSRVRPFTRGASSASSAARTAATSPPSTQAAAPPPPGTPTRTCRSGRLPLTARQSTRAATLAPSAVRRATTSPPSTRRAAPPRPGTLAPTPTATRSPSRADRLRRR